MEVTASNKTLDDILEEYNITDEEWKELLREEMDGIRELTPFDVMREIPNPKKAQEGIQHGRDVFGDDVYDKLVEFLSKNPPPMN